MLQEEDDEEVRGDREGDDGDVKRRPMSRYEKKLKEVKGNSIEIGIELETDIGMLTFRLTTRTTLNPTTVPNALMSSPNCPKVLQMK